MMRDCYAELFRAETTTEALDASYEYLVQHLRKFLQKQDPVLICFPDDGEKSFGHIAARAVAACGAEPVTWGPDYRWKELLRLCFDMRIHAVIAHPLVVLGLMKVASHTATPLYICHAVLAGYPFSRWMVQGIKKGLDCRTWGCYAVRSGPIVVGFSCECNAGIHVREEAFEAITVDERACRTRPAERGKLLLTSRKNTELIYDTGETTVLQYQPCSCGCSAPRIMETRYIDSKSRPKSILEDRFLTWSSVLDYRARQTESGIDLEIVVFPGEPLPKIPSCAKLTVRQWDPEKDVPFIASENFIKIPENY